MLLFIFNVSYLLLALANPGLIDRNLKKHSKELLMELINSNSRAYCARCKVVKNDPNTVHCTSCDICVEKYDHHCAWSGKCIGGGNQLLFYAFNGSIFVLLVYLISASLYLNFVY